MTQSPHDSSSLSLSCAHPPLTRNNTSRWFDFDGREPWRQSDKSEIAPFALSGPRVRMGIHAASSEATTTSSRDENGNLSATSLQSFSRFLDDGGGRIVYSGPAVTMTRVLSDSAAGGQILLSETAAAAFDKSRSACAFAVIQARTSNHTLSTRLDELISISHHQWKLTFSSVGTSTREKKKNGCVQ